MKTIADITHNETFPLKILDDQDNLDYYENSSGYWIKWVYDSDGNERYYIDSNGFINDNR